MYKSLFVALVALFFFTACQNAAKSEQTTSTKSVPVNAEDFKETETAAIEVSNPEVAELATDVPDESNEKTAVKKAAVTKTTLPPPPKKVEIKDAPKPSEKTTPKTYISPPPPLPAVEEEETATMSDDENEPAVVDMTPSAPVPSHDAWDGLLRKYVDSSGKVDYAGMKSEKSKLEAYLKNLQDNPPVDGDWSRKEKLAFWINAYNAFTVKLIVDNYPVASITKLEGGKPWDKKWIKIGGKTYTLNNIENDIIRPQFKEPRIHFAVNCAAKSCPPLLNRAWTASNLNSNFEKQAKAFVNNSKYNEISGDKVKVSKIFEWYAVDFGNLIDYLNKYSNTPISSSAKIEYLEYNWDLNK